MIIKSVSVDFPSKVMTNEMTAESIKKYSKNFEGDLDKMVRQIMAISKNSGLKTKRVLADREKLTGPP